MKPKLEILCGPSGVGKTTKIDEPIQSHRYTTRSIRPSEISSDSFDGTKSTHGYFISEEEFNSLSDKLVGVHRYPDPLNGHLYGFDKKKISEALENDSSVIEQIVNHDAYKQFKTNFENAHGKLVLAFPSDYEERLIARQENSISATERINENKKLMLNAMDDLSSYDSIVFNPPFRQGELIDLLEDGMGIGDRIKSFSEEPKESSKPLGTIEYGGMRILDIFQLHKMTEESKKTCNIIDDQLNNSKKMQILTKQRTKNVNNIIVPEHLGVFGARSHGENYGFTPILYPDVKSLEHSRTATKEGNIPDYYKFEIAGAFEKIFHIQSHFIEDSISSTALINKYRNVSMPNPKIAYPYYPIIMSGIYEELGDSNKAIKLLEDSLNLVDNLLPNLGDAHFISKKGFLSIFNKDKFNFKPENVLNVQNDFGDSMYGNLLSESFNAYKNETNESGLNAALGNISGTGIDLKMRAFQTAILDATSIIEDRYNRLTGNRTSRWKDKQVMIDQELKNQKEQGLKFESYIRY